MCFRICIDADCIKPLPILWCFTEMNIKPIRRFIKKIGEMIENTENDILDNLARNTHSGDDSWNKTGQYIEQKM